MKTAPSLRPATPAPRLFTLLRGFLLASGLLVAAASSAADKPPAAEGKPALEFIDTSFENASPLWYEFAGDGTVLVHLLYDQERNSPNRAAGHFHFRLHAPAGEKLTLEFRNLDNVWNRRPGSVAKEIKMVVVSQDGRKWTPVLTEALPENRVRVHLEMPGPSLYVARAEPYRLSDLNRFLDDIRKHPLVTIAPVGKTVQGRNLEIIQVGHARAPHAVFLRARAHPWEPAGNWVAEGLVRRLLRNDPDAARFLERYRVAIMPMANKDGVERGGTRFNLLGRDLNRNWDRPADPQLAPENAALEQWLAAETKAGRRPNLAMDLHNDGSGLLHVSRPDVPDADRYVERMARLEQCLRRHTWFTEGSTKPAFRNPGSMGEGLVERFGIDAVILEFNCNHIAGLNDHAVGRHWLAFGEGLAAALHAYFEPPAATSR